MSARDHLHPGQLKMFMTAHEITAQYQGNDEDRLSNARGGLEDDAAMLTRKYREASTEPWDSEGGRTLASSIRSSGVHEPVDLTGEVGDFGRPQVFDGGHRLAVEAFENRHRLMPVMHHRTRMGALAYHYDQAES